MYVQTVWPYIKTCSIKVIMFNNSDPVFASSARLFFYTKK